MKVGDTQRSCGLIVSLIQKMTIIHLWRLEEAAIFSNVWIPIKRLRNWNTNQIKEQDKTLECDPNETNRVDPWTTWIWNAWVHLHVNFFNGKCYITTHSSAQFSHSVTSNSLWPRGLQHARLPSPSPTPEACSNSCPSSQWCHRTISSSVVPFSSCPQFFPASWSFPMSQLLAWIIIKKTTNKCWQGCG